MKLKREEGTDGKGVVLKNVKYFGAQNNDGFEMYRSLEHSATNSPTPTVSVSDFDRHP